MAVLFFVLAALACAAHCKPSGQLGVILQKSSKASANAGELKSTLSEPWTREMKDFEKEINNVLHSMWPLLNMLFDFDSDDEFDDSSEEICADEMNIQLVPEDNEEVSSTTPPSPVAIPAPEVSNEESTVDETK